jgi:hypothetical protein
MELLSSGDEAEVRASTVVEILIPYPAAETRRSFFKREIAVATPIQASPEINKFLAILN